jgi:large subunit ribosomal protein L10
MNVKRQKKEDLIKEINENFDSHDTFYLFDFINMPVSRSVELRRKLREHSYTFKVVKNRLALRAFREEMPEDLKAFFRGPTAIAFASENPLQLARLIRDFSDQHKILKFKAGLLEGHFLPEDKFAEVADLTSRDTLIVKFGFLMVYPLIKFLRTWQAPTESLGRLLSQIKPKKNVGGKNVQSTNQ